MSGAEGAVEVVVAERREVADGVALFRLVDPSGEPLPGWSPGAHIDVMVTPELTRQYSLCGSPSEAGVWQIAVLREPESRGGSARLVDEVLTGARLSTRGPRNHFALEVVSAYRFVAGGIGVTPMIPMIEEAEAAGADWRLLYGGRSLDSMAMATDLHDKYGDRVLLRPQDEHGLLDLADFTADLPDGAQVYGCGPEPLLDALTALAADWPAGTLHLERFSPVAVGPDAVDIAFEVELARTGVTVTVPADRSILEVVEEAGAFVTSSCAEGACGSCETMVLAGTPDHRDAVLDEAARASGESMMVCVSRCRGDRLVLDL